MHISRIQVEEGFLNGLDLKFSVGLNVIIGARGTGKTSLIELIRYCLGVPSYTSESGKRSHEHALSILGAGQVTVTLVKDGHEVSVSRTASDESPRSTGYYRTPIIFSQTEIETVGLQAGGRLALLDGFIAEKGEQGSSESEAIAEIKSLATETDRLRREIEDFSKQATQLKDIEAKLKELAPKENLFSKLSADAAKKKEELDMLSTKMAENRVVANSLEGIKSSTEHWHQTLKAALNNRPSEQDWPPNSATMAVFDKISVAAKHLQLASQEAEAALGEATSLNGKLNQARVSEEQQARQLRKEIESLQAGAGDIARESQQLKEKKAQLLSLNKLTAERKKKLQSLLEKRDEALDRLEGIRENRFRARKDVEERLNRILGPKISIKVQRAGQFSQFASVIADTLRGSGLRYNDLAPLLAEKISPRELIEAIDTSDYDLVSEVAGISRDRAAKLISYLQDADIGELATVPVEDHVALQLLDGSDFKDISELSTGQRCTVILPLVLQHTERVLIVDQPEDHIDNAFITETLIKSITSRPPDGQIIFSTHNANVPVLGNAELVVQMGSDGKRGFIREAAPLSDSCIVSAISTVMEGGAEAFKRRAQFYDQNSNP